MAKRRRVTSYIPSKEWSDDNRSIDIVTLEDMQEEYALVLAQLKLAGQDVDFHLHGMCLSSPDESCEVLELIFQDLARHQKRLLVYLFNVDRLI